jgi:hypothetical protein
MTPAEALSHMDKGDPDRIVPPLYRVMSRETLSALVEEVSPERAAPPAGPPVQTLLQRAIARPGRLRTPARRRVAFLQHLARCRTLEEASARSGIDPRTVTRWRRASPSFDRRLSEVVDHRREDALEIATLMAVHPRIRPIFYRGKKVGENEIPNTSLALYFLKRADAEALRDEKRRDEAAFEARVQQEVERRMSKMSGSAGHRPSPARPSEAGQKQAVQDEAPQSPAPQERPVSAMSDSPGHRVVSRAAIDPYSTPLPFLLVGADGVPRLPMNRRAAVAPKPSHPVPWQALTQLGSVRSSAVRGSRSAPG